MERKEEGKNERRRGRIKGLDREGYTGTETGEEDCMCLEGERNPSDEEKRGVHRD